MGGGGGLCIRVSFSFFLFSTENSKSGSKKFIGKGRMISYLSPFSPGLNDIKVFERVSQVSRKTGLKILSFSQAKRLLIEE